jgi:hypothetical protein
VQAVFKKFDGKIAKHPRFPKVIQMAPYEGFIRPCWAKDVETQLSRCPSEFLEDLRAVFILSGTRKQLQSWGRVKTVYGTYWQRCVFLHAYPFGQADLNDLHRYYLRNVLMHEIGHHMDTLNVSEKDRERFAEQFAEVHG